MRAAAAVAVAAAIACGVGAVPELPRTETTACGGDLFRCNNGRCIIPRWKCDGDDDCGDGSDETPQICSTQALAQASCSENQFTCADVRTSLKCIPIAWMCDDQPDCPDGSDEANCGPRCGEKQFTCQDGTCISDRWKCDGDADCSDGSDELGCQEVTCDPGLHFSCSNGQCVDKAHRCDGDDDCVDGSDEQGCPVDEPLPERQCRPGEAPCGDGVQCIHRSWLCDGDEDCANGSDEDPSRCAAPTCRADQFQCGGLLSECIPASQVCSGQADCRDGSDEANCTVANVPCDAETEFSCENGRCVALQLVCNAADDCGDGSDEAGACARHECATNGGGCSHGCMEAPGGRRCLCPDGFQLKDDGATCEDVDECAIPGSCSQICINQVGHYKCECKPGYLKDPANHTFCKAATPGASLLLTHGSDIRNISLHGSEMTGVVTDAHEARAVDYDYRAGVLYWADSRLNAIYRAPLDRTEDRTEVASNVSVDGMAVDWLYGRMYWVQLGASPSIEASDLSGQDRTTLISKDLDRPRSLALDPDQGWMYWSDWGTSARIERAGMDGSHRQVIIDTRLEWPNGISLDLLAGRIFWVDAKLRVIESADLDGSNRRIVFSSERLLEHPFSVATFEDSVFWTDHGAHIRGVFSANKFTGDRAARVANAGPLHIPTVVRAYHRLLQPSGTNWCAQEGGRCSHLCLPAPALRPDSRRTTCACPAGLTMSTNGVTCNTTDVPTAYDHEGKPVAQDHSAIGIGIAACFLVAATAAVAVFVVRRRRLSKGFRSVRMDKPASDFSGSEPCLVTIDTQRLIAASEPKDSV